jgi:hypothetical protein
MNAARIVFEKLPGGWTRVEHPGFVELKVERDLNITVPLLRPLPEDLWHWAAAPERDLPPGAKSVEMTNRFSLMSDVGWPLTIAESVAMGEGGDVVEARIHYIVVMLYSGAIVSVRTGDPALLSARRDEVHAAMMSLRPDWGDVPNASLHDLMRV